MKEDPNYLHLLKDRVKALRSDASRSRTTPELRFGGLRLLSDSSAAASAPRGITGWLPYEKLGKAWLKRMGSVRPEQQKTFLGF